MRLKMSNSEQTDYRQNFGGMMMMMAQIMSHAVLESSTLCCCQTAGA